jgi:pimeloyl-ACP methyl ester carboxylesterase
LIVITFFGGESGGAKQRGDKPLSNTEGATDKIFCKLKNHWLLFQTNPPLTMNRTLYQFGIFFLAITMATGTLQSIIQMLMGPQMNYLQPFANWYLVVNIISIGSSLFILKYFYHKQYLFAFWTGVLASLLQFAQCILIYVALIFVLRELQIFSVILAIAYLFVGIVLASALIFSRAEEKAWLKIAGIYMLVLYVSFECALVWGLISNEFMMSGAIQKMEKWISLAANLIPLFFMLNFRNELRLLPKSREGGARRESKQEVMIGAGMLMIVVVFIMGGGLIKESYWSLHWNKNGPEEVRKLAARFESRVYVSAQGNTLRYLLMKPLDYDSTMNYPLVICLHGGPVPERKKELQVEVPEPAPVLSTNRQKYPAFIFVPQGPPGHTWGGISHLPSVESLVLETIGVLENEFNIDAKRRYITGVSMGGYGTWHFIGTHPEMFAAAMPICGAGDVGLAKNMVNVPVWAFHGDKDRNVAVSGSRNMIEAIKKAGGNPLYTEFEGVGHNVWPSVNETPGVLDWLFAQKRK